MRWLLAACVLVSALGLYDMARADTTVTVEITATGWVGQCIGPTGLTATRLSDHSVRLDWTPGFGANSTTIWRAFGECPAPPAGAEVYEGNGTTVVDYVDLTTLDTYVCWRAYTVCGAAGNYSQGYAEARLTGGVTVMYIGIFGLCLGMSWIAFRGRFILWSVAASISWVALWMYFKANPPSGITEGDPTHSVLMLIPVAAAVAVMLHGLYREVQTQKDYGSGLVISKLTQRMPWQSDEPKERAKSREEDLDDYRTQMRAAFRNRRGRRR